MPAREKLSEKTKGKSKARAYLTKRVTASAAKKGFEEAARETVRVMGYNVIAKDGWVVKVDASGNVIDKISKVPGYHKTGKIRLD